MQNSYIAKIIERNIKPETPAHRAQYLKARALVTQYLELATDIRLGWSELFMARPLSVRLLDIFKSVGMTSEYAEEIVGNIHYCKHLVEDVLKSGSVTVHMQKWDSGDLLVMFTFWEKDKKKDSSLHLSRQFTVTEQGVVYRSQSRTEFPEN
ncbi:MAG TPA: hypothetical protein VGE35_01710 [Candidatus Paceibacterota bacterium]